MATHAEHRSSLLKVIAQPEVQQLLDQARERFSEEEGVSFRSINLQFQRPVEHDFTADQRPHTTMLFGGFTFRHEYLIQCHFKRLGYNVEPLPTPNTDAFQKGKEYGNNGQCNPTYFTVGNLVQYLEWLRDEQGMSTQEIIDKYFRLEKSPLVDGWFPTGDVGTLDPDGYLQITDRSKDVIKSGGEWISSIDLENLAMAHPAVAMAAVIGVYHPKWDERPLLVVVKKPCSEVTAAELI